MLRESTNDGLRVLQMDDGKVNFLSLPMREALIESLQRAASDASIEGIVLAGCGSCFCAGMNIDDFEAGTALLSPSLHNEILDCLSSLSIPVVAAIHGGAHGGGLELALGCHYRVAVASAKLSLPEVLVGLMPGARGTQHLPRAVGLAAAADMILNGRRVSAVDAPAGLIDQVTSEDLLSFALGFARDKVMQLPPPRLQDKIIADVNADLRHLVHTETAGLPGIEAAIELLNAAVRLPYGQAVKREFEAFTALKDSEVSKPYRDAFLARLKTSKSSARKA